MPFYLQLTNNMTPSNVLSLQIVKRTTDPFSIDVLAIIGQLGLRPTKQMEPSE